MNIKMPKKLNLFEAAMRSLLKTYIQRGKVDIYVTYEDLSDSSMLVRYNGQIAGEYYRYLNLMAEEFHLENDVRGKHPVQISGNIHNGRGSSK